MTSPRRFAKILYAADGEQVLFVVDKINTVERLQACSLNGEGDLVTHTLSFDKPGLALQLLDAVGDEQAEIMRDYALNRQPGGMAAMLGSVGMLQ